MLRNHDQPPLDAMQRQHMFGVITNNVSTLVLVAIEHIGLGNVREQTK